jgi:subtilisin family serine protease
MENVREGEVMSRIRMFAGLLLFLSLVVSGLTAHAGEEAPNSLIVLLDDGVAPEDVAKTAAEVAKMAGGTVKHVYPGAVPGFAITLPVGTRGVASVTMKAHPKVKSVHPDGRGRLFVQRLPEGIDRIGTDDSVVANIDNVDDRVDVDVAIIDTGIDLDHPDLNVVYGQDFVGHGTAGDDVHGHGTHVAGTVAALDNDDGVVGVAPGARLHALNIFGMNNFYDNSDFIAAIVWVTDNADTIDVVNMSIGEWPVDSTSHVVLPYIAASTAAGVVYVAAAGNSSRDIYDFDMNDPVPVPGGTDDTVPAAFAEVITVSAMCDTDGTAGADSGPGSFGDEDDTFAVAFTNFCDVAGGIDLAAPGEDVYSCMRNGSYGNMSGTSMASPHVAGAAALYIAAYGRDPDGDGDSDYDDVNWIRNALVAEGEDQDVWGPGGHDTEDPDSDNGTGDPSAEPLLNADFTVVPALSLNVPSSILERDSDATCTVSLFFPYSDVDDLTVRVTSPDTGELTVNGGATVDVVIPATQTVSNTFTLAGVDDAPDADGPQTITLTAVEQPPAVGVTDAAAQVVVEDFETRLILAATEPVPVQEGTNPTLAATVSIPDTAGVGGVVVTLASDDDTELDVPGSVTILQGTSSIPFTITVVDDSEIDGDQIATITATANQRASDTLSVTVQDDETQELILTIPATATENDGIILNGGLVEIPGTFPADLDITITSDDHTEVEDVGIVRIPTGGTQINFNITIVDDTEADGNQIVNITASAPGGWTSDTEQITVTDIPPPITGSLTLTDRTTVSSLYSNELTVTAEVTVQTPTGGILADATHMRFSDSASGITDAAWQTYASTSTQTFTVGDGLRTLYCQLKNDEGNSNVADDAITIDTEPPSVADVTPANKAEGRAVDTTITATFNDDMIESTIDENACLVVGASTGIHSTNPTYDAASKTVTLHQDDDFDLGEKVTVTIRDLVQDKAENTMATEFSWSFYVTETTDPPILSGVVVVDRVTMTPGYTGDTTVLVRINASGSPEEMRSAISQAALDAAAWVSYEESFLHDVTAGDGTKEVWVQLRNSYGQSGQVSGTIVLDTVAPIVVAASPVNGATDVARDGTIAASFSEGMLESAIVPAMFSVVGSSSGSHDVSPTYDSATRTVTFNQELVFTSEEIVTCTVKMWVFDLAGNTMDEDYTWSFAAVGNYDDDDGPGTGVDEDGDGMDDSWEINHDLDPEDPTDALLDPDGDGLSNLQEYQLDSNPYGNDRNYGDGPFGDDDDDSGIGLGGCFLFSARGAVRDTD